VAKRFGFNQFLGQSLRRFFAIFAVSLLAVLGGLALLSPPAIATVLYSADTSGSVIVQSRRTLRDQHHSSWQAIAFKPIFSDGRVGALSLRLVGFPGVAEIAHPQAIVLTNPQGQSISVADISDQISAQISANLPPQPPVPQPVGQYDLQASLPQISIDYRLQLELPTRPPTLLQLPPALLQEWQTIANTQPSDLIHACTKFPIEAQHNPNFPAWVGCSVGDR
jgi:Protein of unknown function (DUF3122)